MGFRYAILRMFSFGSAADFLLTKIIDFTLEAQKRIKGLKDYSDAPREIEWDSILELLSFAYFATSKILTDKYKNEKKTNDTLTLLFEKIITDIVQHRNPKLKYNLFHDYFDQVFIEHCEDYDKYNFNIKDKDNVVINVANKIARIYGKKADDGLKAVVGNFYENIIHLS